jgi:hypothetical protein
MSRGGERWRCSHHWEHPQTLKEESDFRNERDVVPAGIRTGPNPQNYFFCFFGKVVPCNETPRKGVFRVLEFFEFFRVFSMGVGSGRGVSFNMKRARARPDCT